MHYKRWKRHGDPEKRVLLRGADPVDRFWQKVDKTDSCWMWRARVTADGYGSIEVAGREVLAHRFSYETFVGPIPEGLAIDHLCRVRNCVNPAHMEPVTWRENTRRGVMPQGLRTHCPQGHPYDGENLYEHAGRRHCRICGNERSRRHRERRRSSSS